VNWKRDQILRQLQLYVGMALIFTGGTAMLATAGMLLEQIGLSGAAILSGFVAAHYVARCDKTVRRLTETF
jgi:hypothetical protein